jgi:hypothetical protein
VPPRAWLPWAVAGVVLVAAPLGLRRGAAFGPDAWTYWSASVSLLEGCGYTDAFGLPVRDWPPGYSCWLAAVQALLGVSVRSVVVADALAGAVWAGFLTAWIRRRAARAGVAGIDSWAAAFAAASALLALRGPGSQLPMLAALAVALWAVERWRAATSCGAIVRAVAVVAAAAAVMVASRHAALALVAALGAMLAWPSERTRRERFAAAAAVGATAAVTWWSLRFATGQVGTFPLQGGSWSLPDIAAKMARGIDRCLAPFPLGLALAVAAALAGGPLQRRARGLALPAPAVRHGDVVAFAAVGLLGTATMFAAVAVTDPPGERFVRFAALSLGGIGIVMAAAVPHRGVRLALLALLVLPSVARAGRHVVRGREGRESVTATGGETVLPWTATLSRELAPGTVLPDGRVVVAAPRFHWLDERLRAGEGR